MKKTLLLTLLTLLPTFAHARSAAEHNLIDKLVMQGVDLKQAICIVETTRDLVYENGLQQIDAMGMPKTIANMLESETASKCGNSNDVWLLVRKH